MLLFYLIVHEPSYSTRKIDSTLRENEYPLSLLMAGLCYEIQTSKIVPHGLFVGEIIHVLLLNPCTPKNIKDDKSKKTALCVITDTSKGIQANKSVGGPVV